MVTPSEPLLKQKSQDMGAVRAPSAKGAPQQKKPQQVKPIEIIQQSIAKEMPDANPEQIINTLWALVQRGAVKLVQIGNTVFSIMPKGGNTAEFHTFTIEDPQVLVSRFKAGANTLKQMGFKQAVTYAESPAFVKMAQQTGLPVKISQGSQKIGGQQKPVYQFILDL